MAEAGAALRGGCAALAPQTSGSVRSMTLMRRSPPAALQKPFRYATRGALPALSSLTYISVLMNKCCGRPNRGQPGARQQGLQGQRRVAVRTEEENATGRSLKRAAGAAPPHKVMRDGWAAAVLESHMSTAERPEWYCVRTADVAASPHASLSLTSHQSRTTCALRSVEKSSVC